MERMKTSVLDYLERTRDRHPNKVAFEDLKHSYTFEKLVRMAQAIGTTLIDMAEFGSPVVVFMEKSAQNIPAFLGTVYAGDYYVPIDKDMPRERVELIFNILRPKCIICDEKTFDCVDEFINDIPKINISLVDENNVDDTVLSKTRGRIKSTDLLYVLFTSGSTGVPKGVTISHAAVMDFMEWICSKYHLNEETSLCNQAPFYFDASIPDIYIPLKSGASTFIPPKSYYVFPKKILQFIHERQINTIFWVPSALCNVVNTKAFEICEPLSIELVVFCGEVMPCKHLNVWRKHVPNAHYVNMYGPTEATYACMYYDVERDFADEETLPLGKACENSSIYILTDGGNMADVGEIGEICITGVCLSYGYYNNKEMSEKSFTQNPLNNLWNERIYHTGDLAVTSEKGEILFCGRKDFQIKRQGYRIEIGEIESALYAVGGVDNACCILDRNTNDIVAFYTGEAEEKVISDMLKKRLMPYMIPSAYLHLNKMPMSINGKIDRGVLQEECQKRRLQK